MYNSMYIGTANAICFLKGPENGISGENANKFLNVLQNHVINLLVMSKHVGYTYKIYCRKSLWLCSDYTELHIALLELHI